MGMQSELISSVDSIDFLHSYASVFLWLSET